MSTQPVKSAALGFGPGEKAVGISPEPVKPLALRPRGAAKALSIGARTLWGQTAPRGPIPCIRIGEGKRKTVLYSVADLQAWLSQQAEAAKTSSDDAAVSPTPPMAARAQAEAEKGGSHDAT